MEGEAKMLWDLLEAAPLGEAADDLERLTYWAVVGWLHVTFNIEYRGKQLPLRLVKEKLPF